MQLHCINSVYMRLWVVPYVLSSVFDFHSVHFSETKDFCEMFKIMKFCAIVLCTCTGTWTSCTCTSFTGTGTCTCTCTSCTRTCTWWHTSSTCYKTGQLDILQKNENIANEFTNTRQLKMVWYWHSMAFIRFLAGWILACRQLKTPNTLLVVIGSLA